MTLTMKKIKFYLYGSGGSRHEEKIVEIPDNFSDREIKEELDEWVDRLDCNSEYIRYGWEDHYED